MKSLLAEVQDWDAAFMEQPSPPQPLVPLEHLRRQIAAQSEMALLLVKACGLEAPHADRSL